MTDNEITTTNGLWRHRGRDFYRIDDLGSMDPFLMSVVSSSDLWMFLSSTGSLTAGRIDADHAFFPYQTDDRLHQAAGVAGPVTVIARTGPVKELWRPFGRAHTIGTTRSLAKTVNGDLVVFEELHHDWGLRFRSTWAPSTDHGWVRGVELIDESGQDQTLDVLDGFVDVMPAGVDSQIGMIRSNLANAYKRSEVGPWGRVALFTLESLISDRAEPGEALTATVVWSSGFDRADVDLDPKAVDDMIRHRPSSSTRLVTGRPGAYLLRGRIDLPARGEAAWDYVIDTNVDHAGVVDVVRLATEPGAIDTVIADVAAGATHLTELIDGADATQETGDPLADAHHRSNVLFNSMRGGLFPTEYELPVSDFADFLRTRNRRVAGRHHEWLSALDTTIDIRALRAAALDTGDPQLLRLVLEYLPLTFSRRHGDPSRPWNKFSIRLRDERGVPLLSYEGNWRDIFQNWEALLRSYPVYLPHVVAKFVNASTIDGYNPYRISRDGIDWEIPDPEDPWSHIGYWGDHQIVYLMRLLDEWHDHDPGAIDAWLDQPLFSFADVPYVLVDHQSMVDNPRDTIVFDTEKAAAITKREAEVGTDGRLLVDEAGDVIRVTFLEKLIVPALAKLSSFVPGGGIWLNTQRPEWNDANNALAGPGLSMVTLFHLRRYLALVESLIEQSSLDQIPVTASVATWLRDLVVALETHPIGSVDDRDRRRMLDALGRSGEAHRTRTATLHDRSPAMIAASEIARLCAVAREHLDDTIRRARRPDDLYHSYNRVSFPDDERARVDHLGPMLEGQVAALSSGVIGTSEALELVEALYDSDMYRADQDTFMLYPATPLSSFPERNRLSTTASSRVRSLPVPEATVDRVFATDAEGHLRFRPGIINAEALRDVLTHEEVEPEILDALLEIHEQVFEHGAFTGRSGRMYRFEGLGSVYWHMVAKLLLAVQEIYWDAVDRNEDPELVLSVSRAYRRIRAGLGFVKDPATYGAIPTDCYSHTPAGEGAQQPGMTGQVKEEILTRYGELGLRVTRGRVILTPGLLSPDDTLPPSPDGSPRAALIHLCGVPLTIAPGHADRVVIRRSDGETITVDGRELPAEHTTELFARHGTIARVDWFVGDESLARWREASSDEPVVVVC